MHFMVSDETVEIHDFQWLHVDKPSPNFTVEYQPRRIVRTEPTVEQQQKHLTNNMNEAQTIGTNTVSVEEEGFSDDDEL